MLPDSLIVNGITYWENGIWHSMGDGVQAGGTLLPPIHTMEKSGNSILIGGQFEHVDTLTNVGGIAQWNQNEWQRVGNQEIIANQILWIQELDGEVHALGTIALRELTNPCHTSGPAAPQPASTQLWGESAQAIRDVG